MEELEEENRNLREKNSELAQEVQFLKTALSQKDKENIELMKEANELRLKLSRLRSGGAAQASKLDAALQLASEEALTHLVQASGSITRTIELTKKYMIERQELDAVSPRWSNLGGSPGNERIHKVPPMLLGGLSIQPVVSLSRTVLSNRSATRSPNPNPGVTHRAVPMHMLQDVYIPLTRIDAADLPNQSAGDNEGRDNSADDLGLDDTNEQPAEESQHMTSVDELEESRRLDALIEDCELEDEDRTPPRFTTENPLEGPSWMLDQARQSRSRSNLEPDSTTPCQQDSRCSTPDPELAGFELSTLSPRVAATGAAAAGPVFTPTFRRHKRPPQPPPASPSSRSHLSGRVLKVVVEKMRLPAPPRPSPPPQAPAPADRTSTPRFDASSPNGITDANLFVSDSHDQSLSIVVNHNDSGDNSARASSSRRRMSVRDSALSSTSIASHTEKGKDNGVVVVYGRLRSSHRRMSCQERSARPYAGVASISPGHSESVSKVVNHDQSRTDECNDCDVVNERNKRRRLSVKDPCNVCSTSVASNNTHLLSPEVSKVGRRRPNGVVSRRDSEFRATSRNDSDSDSSDALETRGRRTRRQVSYKEKPLNRKLRR